MKKGDAMNTKNTHIFKTLILLCITIAPSFHLLSVAPGKRPMNAPSNRIRQAPTPAIIQAQAPDEQPIAAQSKKIIPANQQQQEDAHEIEETTALEQQAEHISQRAAASAQGKQAMSAASLGWFTIASAILIETLNTALGGGIAAGTKSAIKQFMARNEFLNLKNDITKQATKMVEKGSFENNLLIQTDKDLRKLPISQNEYDEIMKKTLTDAQNLPKEQKINSQTKMILKQNKIDSEGMEKATSFSSILTQSLYSGMLNTIIPMVGTLIGYGFTIGLNRLMPTQK
jgi:hypothetical protein